MSLEQFKNRNVGVQNYTTLDLGKSPETGMEKFSQVVKRTFKGELFVGLKVVLGAMGKALFRGDMHTVKYPFEKMPISPRYRAIHDMLRFLNQVTIDVSGVVFVRRYVSLTVFRWTQDTMKNNVKR